jgi:hypothetical protein
VKVCLHAFLPSALGGGELSASRPDLFLRGKSTPIHIWLEDVWTSEPVFTLWKRKMCLPCQDSTLYSSISSHTLVAIPNWLPHCKAGIISVASENEISKPTLRVDSEHETSSDLLLSDVKYVDRHDFLQYVNFMLIYILQALRSLSF